MDTIIWTHTDECGETQVNRTKRNTRNPRFRCAKCGGFFRMNSKKVNVQFRGPDKNALNFALSWRN